jgi:hypothetical protein
MGQLKKGGADKIVMVSGVEPWTSTSDNHSSTPLRMTVSITFFSWPMVIDKQ